MAFVQTLGIGNVPCSVVPVVFRVRDERHDVEALGGDAAAYGEEVVHVVEGAEEDVADDAVVDEHDEEEEEAGGGGDEHNMDRLEAAMVCDVQQVLTALTYDPFRGNAVQKAEEGHDDAMVDVTWDDEEEEDHYPGLLMVVVLVSPFQPFQAAQACHRCLQGLHHF